MGAILSAQHQQQRDVAMRPAEFGTADPLTAPRDPSDDDPLQAGRHFLILIYFHYLLSYLLYYFLSFCNIKNLFSSGRKILDECLKTLGAMMMITGGDRVDRDNASMALSLIDTQGALAMRDEMKKVG